MSEPKQQPKILLHKPKKGQRSPSGVVKGGSTASKTHLPELPHANEPHWFRFPITLTTFLILNAVLVGYAIVRTGIKPSEAQSLEEETEIVETEERKTEEKPKEAESEKAELVDRNSEKAELVDRNKEPAELPESEASEGPGIELQESPKVTHLDTALSLLPGVQVKNGPTLSNEEQQELYKWMLAEKRKMKPATKAEKAQIDAEKALLKDFLRRKAVLDY